MEVADTGAVARLLREGFPPELHRYIAYCQPGAGSFLGDSLATAPASHSETVEQVAATPSGCVVGHAELRVPPRGNPILTYLTVDRDYRRYGIAKGLLSSLRSRHSNFGSIDIDVFASNEPAMALYRALGAKRIQTSIWCLCPIAKLETICAGAIALNLADAAAALENYGFCRLSVSHHGEVVPVDMPSRHVARFKGPITEEMMAALDRAKMLGPTREVLCISAGYESHLPGWTMLLRSHRLSLRWGRMIGEETL